ncbi:hypothetical protein [Streptomyces nanshensis]|uniref:hypothetical protein n=1 Tax=Streptomyces nanshensis TaxID=518642 RepID=UPI00085CBBEB|nr:hypothetical protein [Streptomyces nanshensis]
MSALHVFDLDGVLLRGSTASLEIAAALGVRDVVAELERRQARGELTTPGFAAATHAVWRGCGVPLTPDVLDQALGSAPWIGGIERVFADIRRRGERTVLLSMAPAFAVERLQARWRLDHALGQPFPALPFGDEPYDVDAALTPWDKVGEVKRLYSEYARTDPHTEIVAYGGFVGDVLLFRALPGIPHLYGLSAAVAVNAQQPVADPSYDLRSLADATYDGDDLWAAYLRGRRLMHQPEPDLKAAS